MNPLNAIEEIVGPIGEMRLTRGHKIAIVVVVLIAGMDGFDMLAMAFVAPVVSKTWGIDKAALGLALASSLFGMAGGSLGLSPFADAFGRRPMVLGGLLLLTLGSIVSALSHNVWQLAVSRAITGVGIGLMVPLTTTIAAEFSNTRRRAFAVAATTVSASLGGVIGGVVAAAILKAFAWNWVFVFGAGAGALLMIMTAFLLPETPAYLLERYPAVAAPGSPEGLARTGPLPGAAPPRRRASYRDLFAPNTIGLTIQLSIVYILAVTAAFYLLSWLPQMVVEAGFPPSTASLVSAVSSLVGVMSGLGFGALAAFVSAKRLASGAMIGFGASLALLGFVPPKLVPLMLAASACGFFLSGSTAVFYASMAARFPALLRVAGIGFVMGFGRLLSGLGPYLAGVMFAAGFTRTGVSLLFAAAAALGGVLLSAS